MLAEGPAVKVTSAKLCFFHEKNWLPNRGYSILPVQSTHATGCTLANSASLLTYCAACEARDICSIRFTHTHKKELQYTSKNNSIMLSKAPNYFMKIISGIARTCPRKIIQVDIYWSVCLTISFETKHS